MVLYSKKKHQWNFDKMLRYRLAMDSLYGIYDSLSLALSQVCCQYIEGIQHFSDFTLSHMNKVWLGVISMTSYSQ